MTAPRQRKALCGRSPRLLAAPTLLLSLAVAAGVAGCAGGTVAVPAATRADADYLLQLGLMRGHLLVGHALFTQGEGQAAHTHAKHPSDELYTAMEAQFAARSAPGFAAELEAHAAAAASMDADATGASYRRLVAAIARNEAVVPSSPSLAARVVRLLLEEAAAEYAVGIVDGRLENGHEYQDAYGFTQVALALAQATHAALDAEDTDREVFRRIVEQVASLATMWPSLMPPPRLEQDAARIAASAAQVEREALRLRRQSRFR